MPKCLSSSYSLIGHFRVAVNLIMIARLQCKAFHTKISFVCIWMKTNFQMKSFALSLAFVMRFIATRKWSIGLESTTLCTLDHVWCAMMFNWGSVVKQLEHQTCNPEIPGSSPSLTTTWNKLFDCIMWIHWNVAINIWNIKYWNYF